MQKNLIRSLVNSVIKIYNNNQQFCNNNQQLFVIIINKLLFLESEKIIEMLEKMGIQSKLIQNIIRKVKHRNQNPNAKLFSYQQEFTKQSVFLKYCNL